LRAPSIRLFTNSIEQYYHKIFLCIEANLNVSLREQYEKEKLSIMKDLYQVPAKFPMVQGVKILGDTVDKIEVEWKKYETNVKLFHNEFKIAPKLISLDWKLILRELYCPPITGCFLGLLIGISGMRSILVSKNHYIVNLVDGLTIAYKATVPFLYVAVGISVVSLKGLNLDNMALSWRHIWLSFLTRFIIMPLIGIAYIYLWTHYYGGIVLDSLVFRLSMFFPWALPATATIVVVVNLMGYYIEESGIVILFHSMSNFITLTVMYLLYFILIGKFE
jgi:hypothetical protein